MTTLMIVSDLLQNASHETLLRSYASLTHQMAGTTDRAHRRDLRAQRDLVHAQILTRMGQA